MPNTGDTFTQNLGNGITVSYQIPESYTDQTADLATLTIAPQTGETITVEIPAWAFFYLLRVSSFTSPPGPDWLATLLQVEQELQVVRSLGAMATIAAQDSVGKIEGAIAALAARVTALEQKG